MVIFVNNTTEEEVKLKETITKLIGNNPLIKFKDPVFEMEKWKAFLKAKLFLFPVQWEEAFGLVIAESMACGTPVVAFNCGCVKETMIQGKTGYVVDPCEGIDTFIESTRQLLSLSEAQYEQMSLDGKRHVLDNFSANSMVDNYESLYYKLLGI